MLKNPLLNAEDTRERDLIPGLERSPGIGNDNPLQGKFHGQRSLAGYSPWDQKESDATEHAYQYYSFSIHLLMDLKLFFLQFLSITSHSIGEGDGTPVQYACL